MELVDDESLPARPVVIKTTFEFDNAIKAADDTRTPLLIQFTATWCRRCKTLKQEIADAFDSTLNWIVVDVDTVDNIQERFNVTSLPRFDLYHSGRTQSVDTFDATVSEVRRMLEATHGERPTLEFVDDF